MGIIIMTRDEKKERAAKAFNEGSDARIIGIPRSFNPYKEGSDMNSKWREGWNNVDIHWCDWDPMRLATHPLPPVRK